MSRITRYAYTPLVTYKNTMRDLADWTVQYAASPIWKRGIGLAVLIDHDAGDAC
jgi:hypothetical protein